MKKSTYTNKNGEETCVISFRLTVDLLEEIKTAAKADRRSVSNWLRVAMEEALADPRSVVESEVDG